VLHETRRRRRSGSAVLGSLAAALAAGQVLDHLDGLNAPATLGGTLEWEAGSPAPRRRSWPVHPACGCTAAGGS
jgi:hypothetical protein